MTTTTKKTAVREVANLIMGDRLRDELTDAVDDYRKAKLAASILRNEISATYNGILAREEVFTCSEMTQAEPERVTDHELTYLLSDDDAKRIHGLFEAAIVAGPWTTEKPGQCPALVAENEVRDAGRDIVSRALSIIDPSITVDDMYAAGLDAFDNFLNAVIGAVMTHPKNRRRFAV